MLAYPRHLANAPPPRFAASKRGEDRRPPKKIENGGRSPVLAAPEGLENRGVESAQTNGGVADEQRFSYHRRRDVSSRGRERRALRPPRRRHRAASPHHPRVRLARRVGHRDTLDR